MPTKVQDMKRASRVVNECVKQGLGFFVHQYGLKWHVDFVNRWFLSEKKVPDSLPVRIRKTLESLGGAYVKLGQLLSVRPDLIPDEFCEEFKRLRDDVLPMSFGVVKKSVERELGQSLSLLFTQFDKAPLGSASVAQVHKARLMNGRWVVVKVQREGVAEQFAEDLDILFYLAHKIDRHQDGSAFSPVAIVEEFERYTRNELNFVVEARNIDRFYHIFRGSESVRVPKVHWAVTNRMVVVMDYLPGVKLSEAKLSATERKIVAKRLMDVALKQLFEVGFFHADLHPGNVLVLPGLRVGLLDFGIVGSLSRERLEQLGRSYIALIDKDVDAVVKSLLGLGPVSSHMDVEAFREDVANIINEWGDGSDKRVRVTQLLYFLFQCCARYKVRIPKDLVVFGKGAMTAEGTCLEIDPEFDFALFSKPVITRMIRVQRSPRRVAGRLVKKSFSASEDLLAIPGVTKALLEQLKNEPFRIGIDNTDVRHLGFDLNTSSNRVSYALLISSLIIAGSLLTTVGPAYEGYSAVSVGAFLVAGMLLVPLLVSVLREGRKGYDSHVTEDRGR